MYKNIIIHIDFMLILPRKSPVVNPISFQEKEGNAKKRLFFTKRQQEMSKKKEEKNNLLLN